MQFCYRLRYATCGWYQNGVASTRFRSVSEEDLNEVMND